MPTDDGHLLTTVDESRDPMPEIRAHRFAALHRQLLAGPLAVVLFSTAACRPAAPPAAVRHTIPVDGHPVSVLEKRPVGASAAVLLIHGRTWSGEPDFDLQVAGERLSLMDRLAEAGYAVFAQDLRGYGRTPRDSSGWLTPSRAVADVAAVLAWIADSSGVPDPPVLFGWSYGSMVSMLTAQRYPDRLTGVVLYGFPVDTDVEVPVSEDQGEPPRRPTTEDGARSDFITPGSISDLAVETFAAEALAADPVRTDWKRQYEFNALDPTRLTVPTLFIHGEFDPLVPLEAAGRMFGRIGTGDRQWTVIAGGDHAAHLEWPDVFVDRLVGWLERSIRNR